MAHDEAPHALDVWIRQKAEWLHGQPLAAITEHTLLAMKEEGQTLYPGQKSILSMITLESIRIAADKLRARGRVDVPQQAIRPER